MRILEGKTALITGSNRGIGNKIAELFAQQGADLYLHSRQESSAFVCFCESLNKKYNVSVIPVYFDVTDYNQIKAAFTNLKHKKTNINKNIKLDILVNNAGITHNSLFGMTKIDDLHRVMEINFCAPYVITQYALKLMHNGSSIINIASIAAFDCLAGTSAYAASKAALIAMTKSLSKEVGKKGIRVNAIAPGSTETDMFNSQSDEVKQVSLNRISLERFGSSNDIANLAVFLASENASFITGQVIRIDGGI